MYKKVMVAVDLSDSSGQVLNKAKQLFAEQSCDYQLVCCYEPMLSVVSDLTLPVTGFDDQQMLETIRARLEQAVDEAGLDVSKCVVIENLVGQGLCQHAKLMDADLVMIGSHGRSGLRLLLGSTTNYVLHHAHCDVLAVRITE